MPGFASSIALPYSDAPRSIKSSNLCTPSIKLYEAFCVVLSHSSVKQLCFLITPLHSTLDQLLGYRRPYVKLASIKLSS